MKQYTTEPLHTGSSYVNWGNIMNPVAAGYFDPVFAPDPTNGHHGVAANTARGRAIIFGDALCIYAGMANRFPGAFMEVVAKAGVAG